MASNTTPLLLGIMEMYGREIAGLGMPRMWCKFILNFRHCSSVEVGEKCRSIIVVRNATTAAKVGKSDVQYAFMAFCTNPSVFVSISQKYLQDPIPGPNPSTKKY